MSDKYFIDTNIFIYSFDTENPQKNDIAKKLIANGLENGTGIISYQVIQEFLNVATQKFKKPLTFKDAQNVFTIKKFNTAKMINILIGIADSSNMLQLAELLT